MAGFEPAVCHEVARTSLPEIAGEPVGSRTLLDRLKGGCFAAKASSSKAAPVAGLAPATTRLKDEVRVSLHSRAKVVPAAGVAPALNEV